MQTDGFNECRDLIGANIRRYRDDLKLSQEQLADQVGLDRVYIGYLERGRRSPSLSTLFKLSRALGVPLRAFFQFDPGIDY